MRPTEATAAAGVAAAGGGSGGGEGADCSSGGPAAAAKPATPGSSATGPAWPTSRSAFQKRSIRVIRSASGGCVANRAETPLAKNMWEASVARGASSREPASPPIFLSAPAIPSGLRVNCTAEASARNSRCRLTAALIRLPIRVPAKPTAISPSPITMIAAVIPPLLSSLRRRPPEAAASRTA